MHIKEIRNSFTSLKPFGIDAQLSPNATMKITNPRNIQRAIDQGLIKEIEPILSSNGKIIGYKDIMPEKIIESEVDKDESSNSGS